jgi:hypothetical protein
MVVEKLNSDIAQLVMGVADGTAGAAPVSNDSFKTAKVEMTVKVLSE